MKNNVVFIIPTGIGCLIGGHAGDATPAAKLIAQTCDKLILHPNVVNASDINEMPNNALYVEGSILDRFLEGKIELQEVNSNKILLVVPKPIRPETYNAINASIATIGCDIEILEMEYPLIMEGWVEDANFANGKASGVEELINQISDKKFDALAIASPIKVSSETVLNYFNSYSYSRKDLNNCVNPWGYIEAKVSRMVADAINKPVAHAPIDSNETKNNKEIFELLYNTVVDGRKAAEVISNCYLHCVLRGLHKAPRIKTIGCGNGCNISNNTITALVSPYGCIGRPHEACFKNNIPVIVVKENDTIMNEGDNRIILVENYLEAAGVINCMNAGITIKSVRL